MERGIRNAPEIYQKELRKKILKNYLMRTKIKNILQAEKSIIGEILTVCGWIRTVRDQKTFTFLEINDGSTFSNFQIIADANLEDYEDLLPKLTTGTSLQITGELVESPGKNQKFEMRASKIKIFGLCDAATYPLQKKRHSFEFLRTIAHLRPRTNTQGAVARVRNAAVFATHKFFQERGFLFLPSPIITTLDCEGGGELFHIKTPKKDSDDSDENFFQKPAYLTVSGQLNAETYASALSDVYTFGPTFRAENSNTSRHLAEFWMIEPEMAFADLKADIECAESFLKYVINTVLQECSEDLAFFDKFIEKGLIERLQHVKETPFEILSYTEAVEILKKSNKKFEFPVEWGLDLQSEHERYLTEEHVKKPTVIIDFPEKIKEFYMRENDDGKTVAALDVLVPKIGEIIGGSQREERFDVLEKKMNEKIFNKDDYWWYLQLREFGSVPHSGFGVGFERLLQFITGMENIRDVIPFPRYPGHAEF